MNKIDVNGNNDLGGVEGRGEIEMEMCVPWIG